VYRRKRWRLPLSVLLLLVILSLVLLVERNHPLLSLSLLLPLVERKQSSLPPCLWADNHDPPPTMNSVMR
jgi:hypothetical protein